MKTPKENTVADKIGLLLHKHAVRSQFEITSKLEAVGHLRDTIYLAIRSMLIDEQIVGDKGGYKLTDRMRKYYGLRQPNAAYLGEIVQPATTTWKPLNLSRLPTLAAPRHDALPLRDIGFKCASEAASTFWG